MDPKSRVILLSHLQRAIARGEIDGVRKLIQANAVESSNAAEVSALGSHAALNLILEREGTPNEIVPFLERLKVPSEESIVLFNRTLQKMSERKNDQATKLVFNLMDKKGIQPNAGTYNALILQKLRFRQIPEAKELYKEMITRRVAPDEETLSLAISLTGTASSEGLVRSYRQAVGRGRLQPSLPVRLMLYRTIMQCRDFRWFTHFSEEIRKEEPGVPEVEELKFRAVLRQGGRKQVRLYLKYLKDHSLAITDSHWIGVIKVFRNGDYLVQLAKSLEMVKPTFNESHYELLAEALENGGAADAVNGSPEFVEMSFNAACRKDSSYSFTCHVLVAKAFHRHGMLADRDRVLDDICRRAGRRPPESVLDQTLNDLLTLNKEGASGELSPNESIPKPEAAEAEASETEAGDGGSPTESTIGGPVAHDEEDTK